MQLSRPHHKRWEQQWKGDEMCAYDTLKRSLLPPLVDLPSQFGIVIMGFEYERQRQKEVVKKAREELEKQAVVQQATLEREVRARACLSGETGR